MALALSGVPKFSLTLLWRVCNAVLRGPSLGGRYFALVNASPAEGVVGPDVVVGKFLYLGAGVAG